MKLLNITNKQQEIITLLYKYRYLDRIQIQRLLNHKDKRRVLAWLKDLREKHFVNWIYSTDFVEKSKPAIYYLSLGGISHLKTMVSKANTPAYPIEELRKRYKDTKRSRSFIDRCLCLADCGTTLRASTVRFGHITEADYIDPSHSYHFLAEHDVLRPSLYIQKQVDGDPANYLLEIFDASLPRYRLRRRLKAYVNYLDDQEWEKGGLQPIVLLVFPSLTELIYAKRATKKMIDDVYAEEGELGIWFTTVKTLKAESITAKIWEEGRLRHSL